MARNDTPAKRPQKRAPKPRTSDAKPRTTEAKKKLPVVQARKQVGCLACGLCCTYVAVEIDAPDSAKAASEILWHLYHENVSVYRDGNDDWMVQFESRCRHLADDNKCAIYEQRPQICRDYAADTCEVNAEDEGTTFYSADAFVAYLETRSKRIHRALAQKYLPDASHLARKTPVAKRALAPFEARIRRLRAMGLAD